MSLRFNGGSGHRGAHCFNKRTPACFDVREQSSHLEMDERVYITLSHLISHRTGGEVGSEKGKGRLRLTAK